ncbi:Deoxymugineic acid synthase 1 [Seminavis robusta]|uniref:Deoxymugineic acid synthase 1 n=1 Tax=Seminavis robusta TaxID=568900 RepID=A0A9N8EHS5_9STRA|nr:Deoxymugineic acid synthase 1 [Seminavis robusta]|eukprot:Sro1014_g231390.1 Deoxymugineic acid synthase 1 (310) ;mRNA; f:9885-10814
MASQEQPDRTISTNVMTSQDLSMPRMLYGCAWKKEKTKKLVLKALRNGFRGFDTAAQPKHYFEAGAGEALAEFLAEQNDLKREDLFVQTKVNRKHAATLVEVSSGDENNDFGGDDIGAQVKASVSASLVNLQTTYVDSLLLHSPYSKFKHTLEAWKAMEEAVDQGYAKQIGISNVKSLEELQRLHASARIKPAVVQQRFHRKTGFEREMRQWCLQNGVYFQSFWTLTANSKEGKPGKDAVLSPEVQNMAKKYLVSPQVLFYRWAMHDQVVCPLNGTSSKDHMKEDLKVFEIALSEEDFQVISAVVYRDL